MELEQKLQRLYRETREKERELVIENLKSCLPDSLPLETNVDSSFTISVTYKKGKLEVVDVNVDSWTHSVEESVVKGNIEESAEEEAPSIDFTLPFDDIEEQPAKKKAPSIPFAVNILDKGIRIFSKTAQQTMIDFFKYVGFEKVNKYRGKLHHGLPIVTKTKITDAGKERVQIDVDGWWIYINSGNDVKKAEIQGVADMYNIPISFENVYDEKTSEESKSEEVVSPPSISTTESGKKRQKYSLNGEGSYCKNRFVLASVRLFMKEFPEATFAEVEESFPSYLQGSYGVVRSVSDIKDRLYKNNTEKNRWFFDEGEMLKSGDGIGFHVCNEWAHNFDDFVRHIEKEFGWEVRPLHQES